MSLFFNLPRLLVLWTVSEGNNIYIGYTYNILIDFWNYWYTNFMNMVLYIISYTVYNCPNTEKYRVNKIHIGLGEAEPDMNFIDLKFFVLRTIVHCVTNLSWFCNQTSYLMFSILGQWIYHDFESIHDTTMYFIFQFSMGYGICFTSDSIFFILWQ